MPKWLRMRKKLQNLGFSYQLGKIHKKILLYKAKDETHLFATMHEKTNYLSAHTSKEVDAFLVPGNHDTILQNPHVQVLAQLLQKELDAISNFKEELHVKLS